MKQTLFLLALLTVLVLVLSKMTVSSHASVSAPAAPVQASSSLHTRQDYIVYARSCAAHYGISPDYFQRQIDEESGFQPDVRGSSGEIGIAQFMPATAAGLGINPSDPSSSLCGAARLMASYLARWNGSYDKALASYNAGSGRVASAVASGGSNWCAYLPQTTLNYIAVILQRSCQ